MHRACFADRRAAGRALARRLDHLAGRPDVVVLGLPRGGVVVAAQVAESLAAPLGVVVARKLPCPGAPELAMGAVAVFGRAVHEVRNPQVISLGRVDEATVQRVREREIARARERSAQWQPDPPAVAGRIVIVVDDGLATGATMRAAIAAVSAAGPAMLVAAVPVGVPAELDDLPVASVAVLRPQRFGSVGAFYRDFAQVDDATVAAELVR